jgi:dienelactone hydrolase
MFKLLSLFALLALGATVVPMPRTALAQSARIELHPLPTVTLTTKEFLTGAGDSKVDLIAGELRIPSLGSGRLPVIVMIHGSGGVGAVVDRWSQELLSVGVATFIVDSFTGRGIENVRDDQERLSALTMIVDAYRALALLARHQRVDASRIGLMGFSRGGHVALYASLRRFQRMHGSPGLEFTIYLPFYASCNVRYLDDETVSIKPIRLFHGAADDWVPVGPCREYVAALREKSADIALTEYEGAYHAFDNPLLTKPVIYPNAQTDRNCLRKEGPAGEIVNIGTGQRFTFEDACVERGTRVEYNPVAHAAAIAEVKRLLRVTFGLR